MAVNNTISINVAQSWTNSSVALRAIDKSAPTFDSQAIWTDISSKSFYIWGGRAWFGIDVPLDQIWKFDTDGHGGGSWSTESAGNPAVFDNLIRPAEGAYANSKDTGFWVGGWAGGWTDASLPGNSGFSVPNIVSFNMTTKLWSNDSASAFTQFGTDVGGAVEFIEVFGPNGILLLLGGVAGVGAYKQNGAGMLDFNNLTFYDPVSKEWYWQGTTGDVPPPRQSFCTVGLPGPNRTYEMLVLSSIHSKRITRRTSCANCITLASFSVVLISSLTYLTVIFTY
jgi:hypothetical protein